MLDRGLEQQAREVVSPRTLRRGAASPSLLSQALRFSPEYGHISLQARYAHRLLRLTSAYRTLIVRHRTNTDASVVVFPDDEPGVNVVASSSSTGFWVSTSAAGPLRPSVRLQLRTGRIGSGTVQGIDPLHVLNSTYLPSSDGGPIP
jgi:hypothetical protein